MTISREKNNYEINKKISKIYLNFHCKIKIPFTQNLNENSMQGSYRSPEKKFHSFSIAF